MSTVFRLAAARWQKLQPREQRLALWCGIVVGVALLMSVDDWQRSELSRLNKALPAAETRLATMRKLADELSASAALQHRTPAPASIEQVAASVKANGLSLTLTATGTSQAVVQGSVDFDDWVNWLAGLAAQGWRVERAQVERGGAGGGGTPPGSVKVEASLGAAGA